MKRLTIYLLQLGCLFLICSVCFSCQKAPTEPILTKEQLVENELNKRIKIFKSQRIEKCRKDAYLKASKMADSILIARAKAERIKLGDRPDKPPKPILPDTLSTKDSIELKPLIE